MRVKNLLNRVMGISSLLDCRGRTTLEKNRFYDKAVWMCKQCGQSLIDNAEVIVGGYRLQTGDLDITITINDKEAPYIRVNQEFCPEGLLSGYPGK